MPDYRECEQTHMSSSAVHRPCLLWTRYFWCHKLREHEHQNLRFRTTPSTRYLADGATRNILPARIHETFNIKNKWTFKQHRAEYSFSPKDRWFYDFNFWAFLHHLSFNLFTLVHGCSRCLPRRYSLCRPPQPPRCPPSLCSPSPWVSRSAAYRAEIQLTEKLVLPPVSPIIQKIC